MADSDHSTAVHISELLCNQTGALSNDQYQFMLQHMELFTTRATTAGDQLSDEEAGSLCSSLGVSATIPVVQLYPNFDNLLAHRVMFYEKNHSTPNTPDSAAEDNKKQAVKSEKSAAPVRWQGGGAGSVYSKIVVMTPDYSKSVAGLKADCDRRSITLKKVRLVAPLDAPCSSGSSSGSGRNDTNMSMQHMQKADFRKGKSCRK